MHPSGFRCSTECALSRNGIVKETISNWSELYIVLWIVDTKWYKHQNDHRTRLRRMCRRECFTGFTACMSWEQNQYCQGSKGNRIHQEAWDTIECMVLHCPFERRANALLQNASAVPLQPRSDRWTVDWWWANPSPCRAGLAVHCHNNNLPQATGKHWRPWRISKTRQTPRKTCQGSIGACLR